MTRHINAEGIALVQYFEALRLEAYDDATGRVVAAGRPVTGKLTIGYGHTGPDVFSGQHIDVGEAKVLLHMDLSKAEQEIEKLVTVPLTDNQHAALASFVFNVGSGAFQKSTLLTKLNQKRYDEVPSELARWNKVQFKAGVYEISVWQTKRRNAEIELWNKPDG
jgi:lysozyme